MDGRRVVWTMNHYNLVDRWH